MKHFAKSALVILLVVWLIFIPMFMMFASFISQDFRINSSGYYGLANIAYAHNCSEYAETVQEKAQDYERVANGIDSFCESVKSILYPFMP